MIRATARRRNFIGSVKILKRFAITHTEKPLLSSETADAHTNVLVSSLSRSQKEEVLKVPSLRVKRYDINGDNVTPNYQTFASINLFFCSLIVDDYNKAGAVLNKLRTSAVRSQTTESFRFYTTCLELLLTHSLESQKKLSVYDLRYIIDDFLKVQSYVTNSHDESVSVLDLTKIKLNIFKCLTNELRSASKDDQSFGIKLHRYVTQVIQKLEVPSEALSYIEEEQRGLRPSDTMTNLENSSDIRIVKGEFPKLLASTNGNASDVSSTLKASFDKYLDRFGMSTLDHLCDYIIESRFTRYDDGSNVPMYHIYERLSEDEKQAFLEAYLTHNQSREKNIETHSLDLLDKYIFELPQRKADVIKLKHFKNVHTAMVSKWHDDLVRYLNNVMNKKYDVLNPGAIDKVGMYIQKYQMFLQLFPTELIVSLLLNTLISKTVASASGTSSLLDITRALSCTVHRLSKRKKTHEITKRIFKEFYNEEIGIKLFSALTEVVLNNCFISKKLVDSSLQPMTLKGNSLQMFNCESSDCYPAFRWVRVKEENSPYYKSTGSIEIHPFLMEEFKNFMTIPICKSLYLPMLVPPKSWSGPQEGGYLLNLKPIVNSNGRALLPFFERANQTGQLESLYRGLNLLGSVKWTINREMLKIFNIVMKYRDGFLKIPPTLVDTTTLINDLKTTNNKRKKGKVVHNISKRKRELYDLKGQRIEINIIEKIANAYAANGDILFLPHNIDFRGRAYPMVSTLSHYQDDLVRGLLMFWEGKKLGQSGYKWVQYQLACSFGKSKLTLGERLKFVERNMGNILDSADNPLEGRQWWMKADKPWQTLAICKEIKSIINFMSEGNKVEDYVSRVPIHQDGSCNGLQHYAALGFDEEGAAAVNLVPSQRKQDVYTKVLEVIEKKMTRDANDPENTDSDIAQLAISLLSRKLIKQTVMTTVYGVTPFGATAQINERLKEVAQHMETESKYYVSSKGPRAIFEIRENQHKIALYVTRNLFESMSELFAGARAIQSWLENNCFRIINSFDCDFELKSSIKIKQDFFKPALYKPMMWTTVSGLPVVQWYRKSVSSSIATCIQHISFQKFNRPTTINQQKQVNAISPNFIHSLDAIHMLMTCISSNAKGITFASVHDSFWTHAQNVERLGVIIREQFVHLHTSDIIDSIQEDMKWSVRNSFQLLWIKNEDYPNLIEELDTLRRRTHQIDTPFTTKRLNEILNTELYEQGHNKKNDVISLVEQYEPQLYFRSRHSMTELQPYNFSESTPENIKLSVKKFTPVLMPVTISQKPPTGNLDIRSVLQSEYFFS